MNMSRRPNDARCARFFWTMVIPLVAAVPGYSSATGNPDNSARDDDRYLNVIVRFADIALEHGRDTHGPKHTPLFVDSLSVTDYKPYR
jgi:hypothetical protein